MQVMYLNMLLWLSSWLTSRPDSEDLVMAGTHESITRGCSSHIKDRAIVTLVDSYLGALQCCLCWYLQEAHNEVLSGIVRGGS